MQIPECSSATVELIKNASSILTSLGVVITAIGSIVAAYFAYQAKMKSGSAAQNSADSLAQSNENAKAIGSRILKSNE